MSVDLNRQPFSRRYDHVQSELIWGPGTASDAAVTIAIPTLDRSHLLRESLASALGQRTDRQVEIIIVDNGSSENHFRAILDHLDGLRPANVSLYRNTENIGMFGNWNRCLTLAQGRWINLLNDDDLLKPLFVERTTAALERTGASAVVADSDILDQRSADSARRKVIAPLALKQLLRRVRHGRKLWRVQPRHLFWGNLLGNTVGLMAERRAMCDLGGFIERDYPSSDYIFYTRWAVHQPIYRLDETLGSVRIAENESSRIETQLGFTERGHELRTALIEGGYVPAAWRKHLALFVADDIRISSVHWGNPLDGAAIYASLGLEAPQRSWTRLRLLRLWHGVAI